MVSEVRIEGWPVNVRSRHPDRFKGPTESIMLPPGTRLWKFTDSATPGVGRYLAVRFPRGVVSDSMRRRLGLQGVPNSATEARLVELRSPTPAIIGIIEGSTTDEPQIEVLQDLVFVEIDRRRVPSDLETRVMRACELGGIAAAVTVPAVLAGASPWLLVAILVAIIIGFVYPTDAEELWSLWFGVTPTVLNLVIW